MLVTALCAACSIDSAPPSKQAARDGLVSIPSTPEALIYSPGDTQIAMDALHFNPAAVEVTAGSKVVWGNTDTFLAHRPAADGTSPIFRSYVLSHATPGGGLVSSFAFTFTRTGAYAYHCELHPEMVGKITVK